MRPVPVPGRRSTQETCVPSLNPCPYVLLPPSPLLDADGQVLANNNEYDVYVAENIRIEGGKITRYRVYWDGEVGVSVKRPEFLKQSVVSTLSNAIY
jgi:hypothetical protein